MRLSASQIQTFRDCQRKWHYQYVLGIEVEPNAAAELGLLVHAQLENYLSGGALDFTSEAGYIAASGLHHLPKPFTVVEQGGERPMTVEERAERGVFIEQEFHFEGPSGHTYLGYKDLQVPGVIFDHKTTSDLRWQKTPEALREDVQATLYATDYFRTHPDQATVELRWVYYQTKNTRKSAVTNIRVEQKETWKRFLEIEKTADEMQRAAERETLDLPPNINHCSAYGGCPHQGRCNLSPFERMRSHVEQNKLLASLKKVAAPATPADSAGRPVHAFGPNGAHAGTAAAAAPVAASANKLLSRMQALGAPAATQVAPAAINPPEYQPPPAAQPLPPPVQPPLAAQPLPPPVQPLPAAPLTTPPAGHQTALGAPVASLTATQAGQELQASLQAPEAPAAARGRGRPKKAALPATGLTVKIDVLYLDCGPVGVPVVDATQIIVRAKQRIAAEGLADYRFADFGTGPGMLALAVVAELDALDGTLPAVRLDTKTPEGSVVAVEMVARAGLVVR